MQEQVKMFSDTNVQFIFCVDPDSSYLCAGRRLDYLRAQFPLVGSSESPPKLGLAKVLGRAHAVKSGDVAGLQETPVLTQGDLGGAVCH